MKRAVLVAVVSVGIVGLVLACSGSAGVDIPPSGGTSASGGTSGGGTSGGGTSGGGTSGGGTSGGGTSGGGTSGGGTSGGGTSGGTSGQPDACPPCVPPQDPSCRGTGPCGCGPYVCPDGGLGSTCTWGKENTCGPSLYCRATACGAGICTPLGETETTDRAPVCGCDGITYWNASVAARHGVSTSANTACAEPAAVKCGAGNSPCAAHASCNRLVRNNGACGNNAAGTCWALPKECAAVAIGNRARLCSNDACRDECAVIRSGVEWYEAQCPL